MAWQQELGMLTGVAVAMLLGGLIGAEREFADKPAGFRTHMLVAGAAALFVGLADVIVEGIADDPGLIRADPIRVIEAVITGISFIGAGTIFRCPADKQIEGLTTAASLLISAAVGLTAALEAYVLAVSVAVLALVVLRGLKLLERFLDRKGDDARRKP